MKQYSGDWGWGLLAGTLFGIAVAMILVHPDWITPESSARLYTAGVCIVASSLAVAARNWFRPQDKPPERDNRY